MLTPATAHYPPERGVGQEKRAELEEEKGGVPKRGDDSRIGLEKSEWRRQRNHKVLIMQGERREGGGEGMGHGVA